MRNLDIADTRAKLELYRAQGQLGGDAFQLVGQLEAGGADAIASLVQQKVAKIVAILVILSTAQPWNPALTNVCHHIRVECALWQKLKKFLQVTPSVDLSER